MADGLDPNTAEMELMQRRILEIQERRRERVRWHITKHTAELAIAALMKTGYRPSGKNRRRKRKKRLL